MLEVAEEDILKSLRRDNPWWNALVEGPFVTYTKRRGYFDPFRQSALNFQVKRSAILMGPRRVGKTVLLQQIIESAIEKVLPRNCILYVSLDTPLYSGMSLEKLLDLYEKVSRCDPAARRLIVFDEVQYLKDWEIHLKVLTDKHPNTRFIASGSAAAALRLKSHESGAGRFTDFYLPPLTFAEFLDFSDVEKELIQPEPQGRTLRYKTSNINALNTQFLNYLNYGGYPEAVLNEDIRKNSQRYLGRDIIDKVLLRDLPSLYGIQDIQELNRLFTTIAYHSGGEISLEALASSSGVAKNTISKYLEYLEAAFLIVRVRRVDENGKTFKKTMQFKAYLSNPSMRAALFAPLAEDDPAMGAMVETAIFSQWFHSEQLRTIHYARWKSGRQHREVDLVRVDPATLRPSWAYEVKWSDRFVDQPGELRALVEFALKNGLDRTPVGATTKTRTSESTVDGVTIRHFPCALHCYQIGRNVIEGRPA